MAAGIQGIGLSYMKKQPKLTVYFDDANEQPLFTGTLRINGKEWAQAKKKKGRFGMTATGTYGNSEVEFNYSWEDETNISYISITSFDAVHMKELTSKYKILKTEEPILNFKDLNFKLAVIQQLMYEQEVLTPKFILEEFAELYTKKEIDLYSDHPIDEVLVYYKKLPIPARFAELITTIHICRFHQNGVVKMYNGMVLSQLLM
jgi:hypothetical protein